MNELKINSTQIPHVILRDWMPKLSDTEFRVIMVIADQTYGWQKDIDRISYSQLVERTGRYKAAITRAIKELRQKGYIQVLDSSGKVVHTKEEARGKDLYYRIAKYTSSESEQVGTEKFGKRTSESEHTKETNTKVLVNKLTNTVDKSTTEAGKVQEYGNPHVKSVLKAFSEITGLSRSADKYPERAAWNFHQKYGADNYAPAHKYLSSLWKKDITKIETIKLHYPTYQKDVLKVSGPERILNEEEKAMAELYQRRHQ